MSKEITYDEVKKISELLSKWIKFHSKKDKLEINTNCLYWLSFKLLEYYRSWKLLNKVYPNPLKRNAPINVLIRATNYFEKTGFLKAYPEKKNLFKSKFRNVFI